MKNAKGICLTLALCMGFLPWPGGHIHSGRTQSEQDLRGWKGSALVSLYHQAEQLLQAQRSGLCPSRASKQFDVTWDDGMGAVKIVPNRAYSMAGHTLTSLCRRGKGHPQLNTFLYGGREIALTAYDIGGNNFVNVERCGKAP